ncbi:tautomerase family protein [Bradyrhizobium sp.]|uniref:tautomerase family protein n=1 Tax=Bradyrhizobium sp. TaxID=376 RepID=UPI003C76BFC9
MPRRSIRCSRCRRPPRRRARMPNTLIATRAGWITDPKTIIDAVQSALREALKIPEADRTLRLIEHPVSHFAVPPGRGEKYTLIEVTMFSGRSMDAKRRPYQTIVRNLATLGVPPFDIKITLIETPPENWGLRGGMPASEIDLGFKIDV